MKNIMTLPIRRGSTTLTLALVCTCTALAGATAAHTDTAYAAPKHPIGADFNGDGYADLTIGVIGETVAGVAKAGAVEVLYGSASGPRTDNSDLWTEGAPGVIGEPEAGDDFGYVLAHGDLNDDGYDDLAIGVPYEDIDAQMDAGSVHVLYGSADGLTAAGDAYIDQSLPGVPGNVGPHHFGDALAIGDFDGDGVGDLAVGAPYDSGGTVTILRGSSANGLHAFGYFSSPDGDLHGGFGYRLAAGDFDGNGAAELAIDHPNDAVNGVPGAGRVQVVRISTTKITLEVSLDHSNLAGDVQTDARFGFGGLAAGHIGDDAYDDLAIGSDDYTVGNAAAAGQVIVVRGSASGLDPTKSKELLQGVGGVPGTATAKTEFGWSVAIGDANGDGRGDLAVGSWPSTKAASVIVLFGGANNITTTGAKSLTETSLGTDGGPSTSAGFGAALTWVDANGDGTASLAIGTPYRYVAGVDGGMVTLVPGTKNFPPSTGIKFFSQATVGIPDTPANGDMFGARLN